MNVWTLLNNINKLTYEVVEQLELKAPLEVYLSPVRIGTWEDKIRNNEEKGSCYLYSLKSFRKCWTDKLPLIDMKNTLDIWKIVEKKEAIIKTVKTKTVKQNLLINLTLFIWPDCWNKRIMKHFRYENKA